jgi:hypothetical protein
MNLRELEDVLGIPKEHLEFAMWFLKEKGDLKSGDNGMFILTIQGALSYEDMVAPPETSGKTVYLLPAPAEEQVA